MNKELAYLLETLLTVMAITHTLMLLLILLHTKSSMMDAIW